MTTILRLFLDSCEICAALYRVLNVFILTDDGGLSVFVVVAGSYSLTSNDKSESERSGN